MTLASGLAGVAHAQTPNPTPAAGCEQRGKQLFAAERWLEAAGQFALAYTYGNDPSMLFNMALCYRRAGNGKRALALYQRYLAEAPTSPQRVSVLERIEQLRQELAGEQTSAAGAGKSAGAHEADAKTFFAAERWADAADEFEAAYATSKDSALVYNLALCYRRAGSARHALDAYQSYLSENQDAGRKAAIDARIAELRQALANDPPAGSVRDAAAHEREGKRLFEAGRFADAAVEFESAHTLGRDPAMLFNLAFSQRRAGSANRALGLYQRFLAEAPGNPKRAQVETRIKELQQELATHGAGAAGAAEPAASSLGCSKDSECKGTRVCEQGRCVEETLKLGGPAGCDPPCSAGRACTAAGACTLVASPSAADAGASRDLGPKSFAIGIGLGYASGGSVTIDHSDVSPDGGMLLDLYVDGLLAPGFSLGGYATFSSMGYSGEDVSFKSFGGVVKARLALSPSVRLRPGLTLGYNRLSSSLFSDTVTGMNIGMHVDLAFATSNNFAVVPRLGFFTQPSGGYKSTDVTFGAHFYLTFAIEFGK